MKKPLNVLLAEDSQDDADIVIDELRCAGFDPKWARVQTEGDFLAELEKSPDIILSDYAMPGFSGLRAVELLRQSGLNIPFMLISGTVGEEVAVEAMKHGVTDYFLKDRIARLGVAVKQALDQKVARDEHKRLQVSSNLFRTLVDRSSDGIEVVDPETGHFLDVNETTCERLGFPREEMLSMGVPDIAAGAVGTEASAWRDSVEKIRQAGFRVFESRYRRKDGSTFPVEVSVRYVRLDRDYLIASVRDITEQKLAHARLYRLNRLHTVLSRTADALARLRSRQELYDAVCSIVVEHGLLRMVFVAEVDNQARLARPIASNGAGQEHLRAPTSMISTAEGPSSLGTVGTAIRTGRHDVCNDIAGDARMKPWHETTQRNGFGSEASFPIKLHEATVAVLVLYAGETNYFLDDEIRLMVTVADNLSFALEALEKEQERRQAERKIREYTKELERSNSELQQFAYVASHDLQEPLRAVVGCLQMLDESNAGAFAGRSRELMAHTIDGAKRMQTLINDLLTYSRVGSKGISRKLTDAREMANKALRQLSAAIAECNAVITVDALPQIWADPVQITQLFQNLIGNAIKFRSQSPPEIRVSAECLNGETVFSVRDNGIGIAPEYFERVFGVFQRLNPRREYSGTGIGLAICKKIVERHGGRIWIESHLGEGANFRFAIPNEGKT
jgi:PAS domain S-box-containing protein